MPFAFAVAFDFDSVFGLRVFLCFIVSQIAVVVLVVVIVVVVVAVAVSVAV